MARPEGQQSAWNTVIRERYEYGPNRDLELFFHDAFFSALAHTLASEGEMSLVLPGFDRENAGWMREAIATLEEIALEIGRKKVAPSFQLVFNRTHHIAPIGGRAPSDAAGAQYRAFELRSCGLPLICTGSHVRRMGRR